MTELAEYLKTRRSSLSMTLEAPGPDVAQLNDMLIIASRVPDHGKLAPWRFVLWTPQARKTMHEDLTKLLADKPDMPDPAKKQQGTDKILHAPCVVAVISKATNHPKVPQWEQILSAGAVCQNMLMAANAHGFEAQWLTAWYVYDKDANEILQLEKGEAVAGIIHIGSSSTVKNERPRPELGDIFSIRDS